MNKKDKKEFIEEVASRIRSLDYIKIEDIPEIDLYMDQTILHRLKDMMVTRCLPRP